MINMTVRIYRGKNAIPNAKIEYSDGFDPDWTGSDGVAHIEWDNKWKGKTVTVYFDGSRVGELVIKEGGNPWFSI